MLENVFMHMTNMNNPSTCWYNQKEVIYEFWDIDLVLLTNNLEDFKNIWSYLSIITSFDMLDHLMA